MSSDVDMEIDAPDLRKIKLASAFRCNLKLDRDRQSPPAERERVAPVSASQSGPVHALVH